MDAAVAVGFAPTGRSRVGHLAVAVPGSVAGLAEALAGARDLAR